MKRIFALLMTLMLFLSACSSPAAVEPAETTVQETVPVTIPTTVPTIATEPTVPETTQPPPPVPVLNLTEEEQTMLLKIGMAERGNEDCTECIALVMCTILNRVNADRFGSSIRSVLFAQDQFTPVMDGTYDTAEPNDRCRDALEMVIYGWDESQGALYYEWCEGESWHSKNLHLLFQHCDTRFYD